MHDAERPERWVEYFLVHSWLEHLRQHHRMTEADRTVQARINAYHEGREPPPVRHLIAPVKRTR